MTHEELLSAVEELTETAGQADDLLKENKLLREEIKGLNELVRFWQRLAKKVGGDK
ncbi:hypothetical protein QGM71_02530 [Virgibacillus sp. C22-A2]|uniref:Uncharacterized protein n=1 Tax=Virgibacillus tibetensis TaxID=3042313 RepID=A0ABU6KBD9_9BACI|nr:hypothetical protein [Virgibacillus sp. C22-A2]